MRIFFKSVHEDGEWTEGQMDIDRGSLVVSMQTPTGYATPYRLRNFEMGVMPESLTFYGFEKKPNSTREYLMRGVEIRFTKPKSRK